MSDTPLPPDIPKQGQAQVTTKKTEATTPPPPAVTADGKVIDIPPELRDLPQKITIDVQKIPPKIDIDRTQDLQKLTLLREAGHIQIQLPRHVPIQALKYITLPPHIKLNQSVEVHLYYETSIQNPKTPTQPLAAAETNVSQPLSSKHHIPSGQIIQGYILPPPINTPSVETSALAGTFELPPLTIDDPDILQQVHQKIGEKAGIILQNETALDTAKNLSQFIAETQKSLPIDHKLWAKTPSFSSPATSLEPAPSPSNKTAPQIFEVIQHQNAQGKILSSAQASQKTNVTPAADTSSAAPKMVGTVEKFTPQNFPILTLPDQSQIILQQILPLNVGDQVTLQPRDTSLPLQNTGQDTKMAQGYKNATFAAPHFTAPLFEHALRDFIPGYSQTWDALSQTIKTLQEAAPQAAQAVQNTIPQPSARIVPTALFFLMAMKMGRIENWLGDKNISALQKTGKAELIEQLGKDFAKIASRAQENISGDWRHISMPMLHDEQLGAFQLYLHHSNDEAAESDKQAKQKRFIIDFQFSQLGELQLDGLLSDKNLELWVKSEHPLSADMRQEIRQKFNTGINEAQLTGDITFKAGKDHFFTLTTTSSTENDIYI